MSLNVTNLRSRTDLRALGLLITTLGLSACEREPSGDGPSNPETTTAGTTTTGATPEPEPGPSSSSTSIDPTPTEPTDGAGAELPEGCECYEAEDDPFSTAAYICGVDQGCGEYVDRDRDDGEGTGGEPEGQCSPDCETEEINNDAVVECVLEAAAAGVSFAFGSTDDLGDGQYSTEYSYFIRPNEPMHSIRSEAEDLQIYVSSVVNEPVDLEACQGLESREGWDCINAAMMASPTTIGCESKTIDYGG